MDAPWTLGALPAIIEALTPAIFLHLSEALCRTRTDDPFLTMEVLYQLS